ncbi:hypothetical protein K503DRAFT_34040 [Rhizopogon vinicolor AM-OR11-026]|uniref:BTB domain-containing protein n=1 Tax=Rhizopogon vinicolor AM-OR11-026 TaxID=1314800 RepID=A0A1B7MH49_9AGAM|nr:hypothetical protein K503DRAFT_34040 [Rhizopogon vinicolor AM-OR11-026]
MSLLEEAETVLIENMKGSFRVVLVKGVAWKTWHAFVYYCYTGIVNFSSLRSRATTEPTLQQSPFSSLRSQATTKATLQQSPFKDGPPHCSPKSMYQLARKLQNDSLAQLAFKAIETRLSAANILDEALSKFTARHDAVREMEIAFLATHKSHPDVLRGLPAKIEAMAMGNLPHAGPVLTALYQRIAQMPSPNDKTAQMPSSNGKDGGCKVCHGRRSKK